MTPIHPSAASLLADLVGHAGSVLLLALAGIVLLRAIFTMRSDR